MSRILNVYDRSIFDISEHFIKVTFHFEEKLKDTIYSKLLHDENGDEIRILTILQKEPDITAKKISDKTGFSTRKISRIIKQLRETKRIIRIGSDRKGYWKINKPD